MSKPNQKVCVWTVRHPNGDFLAQCQSHKVAAQIRDAQIAKGLHGTYIDYAEYVDAEQVHGPVIFHAPE